VKKGISPLSGQGGLRKPVQFMSTKVKFPTRVKNNQSLNYRGEKKDIPLPDKKKLRRIDVAVEFKESCGKRIDIRNSIILLIVGGPEGGHPLMGQIGGWHLKKKKSNTPITYQKNRSGGFNRFTREKHGKNYWGCPKKAGGRESKTLLEERGFSLKG